MFTNIVLKRLLFREIWNDHAYTKSRKVTTPGFGYDLLELSYQYKVFQNIRTILFNAAVVKLDQKDHSFLILSNTIRLWSHRSILHTVFAIHFTICSPPQTTFKWCSVEGAESGLWWKANHIVYSEYRIQYTPMWLQPYWVLLHQSWLSNTAWIPPIPEVHCNWYRLLLISWCHRLSVIFCSYPSFFFFHHWKWNF